MGVKYFSLFAAVAFLIGCSAQNQDLCGTDPTILWVDDPAHCSRYLYCRRDADTDEVLSVHQLDCRNRGDAFQWFFEGNCVDQQTNCPEACPNTDFEGLFVAIDSDTTCTFYFPCDFPTLHLQCASPLVFNRHTGLCDLPSIAPCPSEDEIVRPPTCPRDEADLPLSGLFPGNRCYEFILCINSVQDGEVRRCTDGQRFVPNANPNLSGSCQIDKTCVQTSTRAEKVTILEAPARSIRNPKIIL